MNTYTKKISGYFYNSLYALSGIFIGMANIFIDVIDLTGEESSCLSSPYGECPSTPKRSKKNNEVPGAPMKPRHEHRNRRHSSVARRITQEDIDFMEMAMRKFFEETCDDCVKAHFSEYPSALLSRGYQPEFYECKNCFASVVPEEILDEGLEAEEEMELEARQEAVDPDFDVKEADK